MRGRSARVALRIMKQSPMRCVNSAGDDTIAPKWNTRCSFRDVCSCRCGPWYRSPLPWRRWYRRAPNRRMTGAPPSPTSAARWPRRQPRTGCRKNSSPASSGRRAGSIPRPSARRGRRASRNSCRGPRRCAASPTPSSRCRRCASRRATCANCARPSAAISAWPQPPTMPVPARSRPGAPAAASCPARRKPMSASSPAIAPRPGSPSRCRSCSPRRHRRASAASNSPGT